MPVITRAIYVPIPGVPEKPTALRHHAPAAELTEQQKKICRELGVTPEAFAAAQRGELFPGARRA